MRISRDWATPLTIGSFLLMAVTGTLMFFHLDTGLNKLAHEWLGWVMVAGGLLHAVANWTAFKRYILSSNAGRAILGLSMLVLAGSFVSMPGAGPGRGMQPQMMAMRAMTQAPIASVAPLTGRTVDQVIAELSKAGIVLPSGEASIASVVGDSREMQSKAMAVLFRKG